MTGIVIPCIAWVCALNDLQNSMIFTPRWPSAGPTGGDGFAAPAGICSLICPVIFFALSACRPSQTCVAPRQDHRRAAESVFPLPFFHLPQFEPHPGRP